MVVWDVIGSFMNMLHWVRVPGQPSGHNSIIVSVWQELSDQLLQISYP